MEIYETIELHIKKWSHTRFKNAIKKMRLQITYLI